MYIAYLVACILIFAYEGLAVKAHLIGRNGSTLRADFDVFVYGSSPAGIAAAVAAGRLGMHVGLFEPLRMIGGMGAAGNLALNDGGIAAERTGLARNFSLINGLYYYGTLDHEVPHPESFVAERTFYTMLEAANVTEIHLDCRLLSANTSKSVVRSVQVSCLRDPVTAVVFIDASYDGDIMVATKHVDYTCGREAVSTYNESLAGARYPGWMGVQGPRGVDPFRSDDKNQSNLIKYVDSLDELAPFGAADQRLMAFQHRMCVSGEESRIPWPKPANYDSDDFMLLQRAVDADHGSADFFSHMPPTTLPGIPSSIKKYCLCCGITIYSTDNPVLNKNYCGASWEQRREIEDKHTYFELGSFYYLANDERVPPAVRQEFQKYGLCADEFVDNNFIPHQLYVRISNRLVGNYVLTQNNVATPQSKPDSIAVADWSFDEHMTGRYAVEVDGEWEVQLEGNFWPSVLPNPGNSSDRRAKSNWYDVPFAVMTPKRGQGENLLVPVALSASAVAFSSARIENMYMSVGTAAGVAAKQLVDGSCEAVQDVDVSVVQAILTSGVFQQRIHGPPGS